LSRGQGILFCLTDRFFLFAFLTCDYLVFMSFVSVCRCFFVVSLLMVLDVAGDWLVTGLARGGELMVVVLVVLTLTTAGAGDGDGDAGGCAADDAGGCVAGDDVCAGVCAMLVCWSAGCAACTGAGDDAAAGTCTFYWC
jgi:hypothetical protein